MTFERNNVVNFDEMERPNHIIQVNVKMVYGSERIYPLNYINELQTLTRQKTLSREQVKCLKNMGFTFEVKNNTL